MAIRTSVRVGGTVELWTATSMLGLNGRKNVVDAPLSMDPTSQCERNSPFATNALAVASIDRNSTTIRCIFQTFGLPSRSNNKNVERSLLKSG